MILTDEELHAAIGFCTNQIVAYRKVEAAVLQKLSKQEPVGYVAHGRNLKPSALLFEHCSIINKQEADEYTPECITPIYIHPTPQKSEWKPIETAPKDGTRILIKGTCYQVAGFGHVYETDIYGWVIANDMYMPEDEPTHWQPLPAPPEAK